MAHRLLSCGCGRGSHTGARTAIHGEANMKLLLVDDEEVLLRAVGDFLARCGHEVRVALNGSVAYGQIAEGPPDVVLTDIRMPEMDGLALLEIIRLRYPSIPVVLITGHGDVDTAVSALQKGAFDYIRKPVKLDQLTALLGRLEQRKQLETTLMQEHAQSAHAGRLASMGTMAAGIAHEINNPTAMIRANLQTFQRLWDRAAPLLRRLGNTAASQDLAALLEEVPGLTSNMLSGTDRIARISNQMKLYSRVDDTRSPCEVDLVRCLEEAIGLTAQDLCGIEIHREYAPARVVGVAQEITQMFVDLLQNAGHSLAGQPGARIAVEVTPDDDGWVCASVTDNGPGIAAPLSDRIFDPFFTTKHPGQGLGLGLSICHAIAVEHRGSIAYEPASGGGACFTVRLPLGDNDTPVPVGPSSWALAEEGAWRSERWCSPWTMRP
jgi:signal transduction histidine kinase